MLDIQEMVQSAPVFEGFNGWTVSDDSLACVEGWAIYQVWDSETQAYLFQLQVRANTTLLRNDDLVWQHVRKRAIAGSLVHQRAMTFLRNYSPAELRMINGTVWGRP